MLALTSTLACLAGCSSLQQQRPYRGLVNEAHADEVRGCEFVGRLSGYSGLTGLFAPKGVDNIRQNLLFEADAKGATHVVFDKPMAELDRTTLTGKAYRCAQAKP